MVLPPSRPRTQTHLRQRVARPRGVRSYPAALPLDLDGSIAVGAFAMICFGVGITTALAPYGLGASDLILGGGTEGCEWSWSLSVSSAEQLGSTGYSFFGCWASCGDVVVSGRPLSRNETVRTQKRLLLGADRFGGVLLIVDPGNWTRK